jgi:hypothetical protein
MDEWENPYLLVAVWWGIYVLCSLVLTCFFKKFLVAPILAHKSASLLEAAWQESLVWGFWLAWQYLAAIVLLLGYQSVFKVIRLVTHYDAATPKLWSEKERKFFRSTPKSLFDDWVMQRFSKYYPEWKPRV